MDASQAVLMQQFPHGQNMQSVLYAAKPEFLPVSGQFVQTVNTHLKDGGLHTGFVSQITSSLMFKRNSIKSVFYP